MKTKILKCSYCNSDFEKPLNEYNRKIRNGKTKFYCSLTCSGKRKENVKMMLEVGKPHHFTKEDGGKNKLITEEQKIKSSMKEFARRVRNRKSKFIKDLDIDSLIKIWNNQQGRCNVTGVKLVLPKHDGYSKTSNNYKASIDRIDSDKPYTNENIQFVSHTVNNLKSDMTDKEVVEFFNIIK